MKPYIKGFRTIFLDIKSRKHFSVATIAFFGLFFILQNISTALSFLGFEQLSLYSRILLTLEALTDTTFLKEIDTLFIVVIGSFLSGCNVAFATRFLSNRVMGGNVLENISSSIGTFIVAIAIGCGACGGILLFLASAISVTLASLLYQSNLLSYIGLGLLFISSIMFSRRMSTDLTCNPS